MNGEMTCSIIDFVENLDASCSFDDDTQHNTKHNTYIYKLQFSCRLPRVDSVHSVLLHISDISWDF